MNTNINESREYKAAKELERVLNDYGFNPDRFTAAIPSFHKTLEQNRDDKKYDDGNKSDKPILCSFIIIRAPRLIYTTEANWENAIILLLGTLHQIF